MGSKYLGEKILNKSYKIKGKNVNVTPKSQAACKAINSLFFISDHDIGQRFSKCEYGLLVSDLFGELV